MPCEIMGFDDRHAARSHEITALLGKGGTGEVYRARGLKLKREVAMKIFPEEFAHDSESREPVPTCRDRLFERY
jgi:serine/threonine protein kinase